MVEKAHMSQEAERPGWMQMKQGVIYYLVGHKRSAVAAVSLHALRKVYAGNLAIMTIEEKQLDRDALALAGDKRLGAELIYVPLCKTEKHAINTTKSALYKYSPFEQTVFIDADTIPVGTFEAVWPQQEEIVLTTFANWHTAGRTISKRIEWWREIVPDQVTSTIKAAIPAINTGVFGFHRHTAMLGPWHDLCVKGSKTFIADEISAQILFRHFKHRLVDDRFNCSPQFGLHKNDVRIWHCHGGKHLRPATKELWLSLFRECWERNIGKIQTWMTDHEQRLYN